MRPFAVSIIMRGSPDVPWVDVTATVAVIGTIVGAIVGVIATIAVWVAPAKPSDWVGAIGGAVVGGWVGALIACRGVPVGRTTWVAVAPPPESQAARVAASTSITMRDKAFFNISS
jgi:hypothetical protein